MHDRVTHADLIDLTDETLVDKLVARMDVEQRELEAEGPDTSVLAAEAAWARDYLNRGW